MRFFLTKFSGEFLLSLLFQTTVHGLTVWNGSVTTDVVDDDISITGNVTLDPASTNSIYVRALTTNITITPITIGWIRGTKIIRKALNGVRNDQGGFGDPFRSLQRDAVGIAVSTNGEATATLLRI